MCDFLRAMKQKHKAQSVSVAFWRGEGGPARYVVVTTENSVLFESRKTKFCRSRSLAGSRNGCDPLESYS
jgi:hypothetical protein